MLWLPLTLMLAGPVPAPTETPAAAPAAALAPPSALSAVPALLAPSAPANPFATPTHEATPVMSAGMIGAFLIIAGLGVAALFFQRRRVQHRHIHVLDTASLGPKRTLALVVVNGQSLLLSCCDSGIGLLTTQPASAEMLQAADRARAGVGFNSAATRPAPSPGPERGFESQLDSQVVEAEAMQQLRVSLAQGGLR